MVRACHDTACVSAELGYNTGIEEGGAVRGLREFRPRGHFYEPGAEWSDTVSDVPPTTEPLWSS